MSGGIDSSLVAAIAVDAIGKENVTGIFMPSPYTSKESREDAYELARSLGIKIIEAPVSNIFEAYLEDPRAGFKGLPEDKNRREPSGENKREYTYGIFQ